MVFRSNTYKGIGFNELSLEDYSGRQEFYIFAQKDKTEKVLNNSSARTDNNCVLSVGKNLLVETQRNKTEYVGGNLSLVVGSPATGFLLDTGLRQDPRGLREVTYYIDNPPPDAGAGHYTVNIGGTKTEIVASASSERIGGDKITHSAGDVVLTSEKRIYFASHSAFQKTVGGAYSLTVKDKISIQCGSSSLTMSSDGSIVLQGISIKILGKKFEIN